MTLIRIVFVLATTLVVSTLGCGEDDPARPADQTSGRSPRITAQPDTTVEYGDTLRLTASAWDPNGDPLTFSAAAVATLSEIRTGYFALFRMNGETGDFWFYPGSRDIPSRSFQFTVTDEDGLTDTAIFKVNVTTAPR
jgi:hypothetical protein